MKFALTLEMDDDDDDVRPSTSLAAANRDEAAKKSHAPNDDADDDDEDAIKEIMSKNITKLEKVNSKKSANETTTTLTTDKPTRNDQDKCPVCLQVFSNANSKSFTSKCFHSFCFECILEWSKVRYACPLCKTDFDRVIYDLKSRLEFKEYCLPVRETNSTSRLDVIPIDPAESNESVNDQQTARANTFSRASWLINGTQQQAPIEFRMLVYKQGWYASPYQTHTYLKITNIELEMSNPSPNSAAEYVTSDNLLCASYKATSGQRNITPDWFTNNPACLHRLVQFIYRELKSLSAIVSTSTVERLSQKLRSQLITLITNLIKQVPLDSQDFYKEMSAHIRPLKYARHFQHELVSYALSTSHSLADYDAKCVYYKDPEAIPKTNEKLSSNPNIIPFQSLPICLTKYKIQSGCESDFFGYLNDYEAFSIEQQQQHQQPGTSGLSFATVDRQQRPSRSQTNSSSTDDDSSYCEEVTPPRKETPPYILVTSSSSSASLETINDSDRSKTRNDPAVAYSSQESTRKKRMNSPRSSRRSQSSTSTHRSRSRSEHSASRQRSRKHKKKKSKKHKRSRSKKRDGEKKQS
jgi:hypothetical protein